MPTAVITGCNSGIGHAIAQIAIKEGYHVHALDMTQGEKLEALKEPSCEISQFDITSADSIKSFKEKIGGQPIDMLLNVAGIMIPPKTDTLETCNLEIIEKSFAVNAYGPFLFTQALLPNILAAPAPRRVAVVSSRVGSISDNSSGGYYAYRASKCAVNNFFKNLAVELKDKDVVVTMLHPGFTKTNLSPDIWNIPGVVEPEVAAGGLWKIVNSKGLEETGKFWHRDDYELPW